MAGRPTKEPGEKMNVPLRVMLTASQDELIRQAVQLEGMDGSSWARTILLKAAQGRIASERKRKGKEK